jgi:hypothetical protein
MTETDRLALESFETAIDHLVRTVINTDELVTAFAIDHRNKCLIVNCALCKAIDKYKTGGAP